MKIDIIKEIGEYNLLLPQLIQKGLAAGDKSRYYLNLLISAIEHADNSEIRKDSLAELRVGVGIRDEQYDTVIYESSVSPEGIYYIPKIDEIKKGLSRAINSMISPFRQETAYSNPEIFSRAESLLSAFCMDDNPLTRDDPRINLLIEGYADDNFLNLIRATEDLLIPLREAMTPEDVYGSTTYLVEPEDIYLIRSFMIGLNRTESLRFEHPGLGTTAIRAGASLLILNEIGMTDYNFLILTITGVTISIQYFDPHISRISFFKNLMHPYPVFWREILSRNIRGNDQSRLLHTVSGEFSARSQEELLMCLSHISSHIVFLIEWNRARKALKPFLSGNDVLKVLQKAVKRNVGHRAFLIAGGERLINEVLDSYPQISMRYGDTLSDVLGPADAVEFCISVLEISNRYVSQNLPKIQLHEDIRTELVRQYTIASEDVHQLCTSYGEKVKKMFTHFTSLFSVLSDPDIANRNAIEVQIQECSADIDACFNRLQIKISGKNSDRTWPECIDQVHKAIEVLGDAGYLCTLIPHTGIDPEIARELAQMSEYNEYATVFLFHLIQEGEAIRSWQNDDMKDLKRYTTNIARFIISSDEILRSARRRKFILKTSGNEPDIVYEICLLLKEVLHLLLAGTASVRGESWDHTIKPDLRISFAHNLSKSGQIT